MLGEYKAHKRERLDQKRVYSDYVKSQNVCQEMDIAAGALIPPTGMVFCDAASRKTAEV